MVSLSNNPFPPKKFKLPSQSLMIACVGVPGEGMEGRTKAPRKEEGEKLRRKKETFMVASAAQGESLFSFFPPPTRSAGVHPTAPHKE